MAKRKKLPTVRQHQIDPFRQLPPQLRREVAGLINALREPTSKPLRVPIEKAYIVRIVLESAATQALLVPRKFIFFVKD